MSFFPFHCLCWIVFLITNENPVVFVLIIYSESASYRCGLSEFYELCFVIFKSEIFFGFYHYQVISCEISPYIMSFYFLNYHYWVWWGQGRLPAIPFIFVPGNFAFWGRLGVIGNWTRPSAAFNHNTGALFHLIWCLSWEIWCRHPHLGFVRIEIHWKNFYLLVHYKYETWSCGCLRFVLLLI